MNKNNININNFGVIKDANIDIAPLNILIGPNSSGKSFIAKLIHCFSSHENTSMINPQQYYKNLSNENKKKFDQFNENLLNYIKTQPTLKSDPFKILIEEIKPLIDEGILKYFSKIYTDKLEEEFSCNLDNLINFNESDFKIEIGNSILVKTNDAQLSFTLKEYPFKKENDDADMEDVVLKLDRDDENILIYINNFLYEIYSSENSNNAFLNIFGIISSAIMENLLLEKSYYIPAERSEITTDRKLLTRAIQNKSEISKNQAEALAIIQSIDKTKKGDFYKLACKLDEEIAKFYVDIEDNDLYNEIIYINSKNDTKTPSTILSTSVHEISLISLYLKYVLQKGDLLIIEEPEAHLHPKNQRILVKYIADLINDGLKIMITTHSDYILDQINNMIRLNNYPKEKLNQINYTENHIIHLEDINIYFFKETEDDSIVCEEVYIDETGFSEDNFSKITDELYDETIHIINTR